MARCRCQIKDSQIKDQELDGNYVLNLHRLIEGLWKCQFCEKVPLFLDDSTKTPSRVSLRGSYV